MHIFQISLKKKKVVFLVISFFLLYLLFFIVIYSKKNNFDKLHSHQETQKSLSFVTISNNLGLVPVGSKQKVVFEYKNISDQEITTESVSKSCSCLAGLKS